MRRSTLRRAAALLLSLILLLSSALALTPDQTRELLETYYVDELPAAVYDAESIEEILTALGDPYTKYFTAEEYEAFMASMEDTSVVGIGIQSTAEEGGLYILSVLPGGSAEEAGVLPGDLVTHADGVFLGGMDATLASSYIRGEEGTTVTITVLRGEETLTFTLVRREVIVAATTSELVDGRIGYIDCTTFGTTTLTHFQEAMEAYGEDAEVWVVDLRANGGGGVNDAVNSAGVFTDQAWLAYLRNGSGTYAPYVSMQTALTDAPVLLLVGPSTASSAEIFASALRDTRNDTRLPTRALILGSRTYGKGVAQVMLTGEQLPDYFTDDAMKITAYRFYSFAGAGSDRVGIIPDLLVDDELTGAVTDLLLGSDPGDDNAGCARLTVGYAYWYIDKATALSEEYRDAFTELLEAIPDTASLAIGAGEGSWVDVYPADLARYWGVTEYTSRGFLDTEGFRYGKLIDLLGTYGIVEGDGRGHFDPGDTTTRAELAALLVKALRCPLSASPAPFTDVEEGVWYEPYIAAAYQAGWIEGNGDGTFSPDAPITQQDVITLIGRASVPLSMTMLQQRSQILASPSQDPAFLGFDSWARPYAELFDSTVSPLTGEPLRLLWDAPDALSPTADATREQAAALLGSILVADGILPL